MLLPVLFIIVAALFATLAQRMGREMAQLPPLRAYTIEPRRQPRRRRRRSVSSRGSSCRRRVWFGLAFAAAVPLLFTLDPGPPAAPAATVEAARLPAARTFTVTPLAAVNVALLLGTLVIVHLMARGAIWSPYYKITVGQDGPDTVVEVNNIFHQSMAPVEQKEYFYQWPYSVFGDTFDDVLILGAGSGTDVAAALRHGAKHVDAVEIDPAILRLGRAHHPDHPYSDPRVTVDQRRRPALSPDDARRSTTWWCSR